MRNKHKKRNVPQEIKHTIAAVRNARIEAGMCNDQRFHERCVKKNLNEMRNNVAKREARRDMR